MPAGHCAVEFVVLNFTLDHQQFVLTDFATVLLEGLGKKDTSAGQMRSSNTKKPIDDPRLVFITR